MKHFLCLLLSACGIAGLCLARDRSDNRWPVRSEQNIDKTLPLSGGAMRLVVDNIEGFVHVSAVDSSDVSVHAHQTIRADSDADLAEAKREVSLDISGKPGTVSVYYRAPWRCDGENRPCEHQERRFYRVAYDIDVRVPRAARVYLSTINHGDVTLAGTTGDFEVKNINGGINVNAVAGSGSVHTINGPVDVTFARNPRAPSSFKTINGTINVTFPRELSADLFFKTFNGQIFSNFEVTALPTPVSQPDRSEGRFVYRSNREHSARVGSGGPELHFETLNGNINLRSSSTSR